VNIKLIYKFILILLILNINYLNAQKTDSLSQNNFNLGVDLMSRYIWRGAKLGSTPSIQPTIEYSKNKFSIGFWGAYGFDNAENKEIDLYLTYSFNKSFSISITDYFFPSDNCDYKYFDYKSESTGHIFEFSGKFKGSKKFPISIFLASNFYGNDAVNRNGKSEKDGIQYSSYIELGYEINNFNIFTGLNLTAPNENNGEIGFYGDNFGIINLGAKFTKEIKITNSFAIPFQVSLITNPMKQKIYMVVGISL